MMTLKPEILVARVVVEDEGEEMEIPVTLFLMAMVKVSKVYFYCLYERFKHY